MGVWKDGIIRVNWKKKASLMRIASSLPFGSRLYKWGQKTLGRLRAEPMCRLPAQVEMVHWLNKQGSPIEGSSFFEVGTGHVPIIPVGFFLSGAASVITADLYRRIDWGLTRDSLEWMVTHRCEVESLYADVVPKHVFDERFSILVRYKNLPQRFLEKAGIEYIFPMDAARTGLPPQSINCHISNTVLEHIPSPRDCGYLLPNQKDY